jgi:hypothetical protein
LSPQERFDKKETLMSSGLRPSKFVARLSPKPPLHAAPTARRTARAIGIVVALAAVTGITAITACGAKAKAGFAGNDGNGAGADGGGSGDDSGGIPNNDDPDALTLGPSSSSGGNSADSMCKGGFYEGQFGGLYSSSLTLVGFNIPVVGDVQLTLHQQGSAGMMCTFEGESEKCSDFFQLQDGTISGTADGLFPYFCTMTGTLDCAKKKLLGGWINCTYCIGNLNDGGMSCQNGGTGAGNAGGGMTGTGGQFAGPLTSDYFYNSTGGDGGAGAIDGGGSGPPSFGTISPPLGGNPSDYDPGSWNGAESLAGYSGMGPLPDGGTLGDYISDAGYGMIGAMNDFGGYGWWWATWQHM